MIPFQNYSSKGSLFHFLFRWIGAWVEDASGQVLDQTDSLCNADLLLLSQLTCQTTLPWVGMVNWQRLCVFLGQKEQ